MTEKLGPFRFHGVEFANVKEGAKDAYGECPYCHNPTNKFSVNLTTTEFKCFHCNASGNVFTFLQRVHESLLKETTNEQYRSLAGARPGLTAAVLRDFGLAFRPDARPGHAVDGPAIAAGDDACAHGTWILPVRNAKGSLVNLRTWRPNGKVFTTSGLPLSLLNLDRMRGRGPVYLAEGDWDLYALERLRREAKAQGSILGVPGAGVFKTEWTRLFHRRDVYVCFDNDAPGTAGAERVVEALRGVANTVHYIQWPSSAPEGFDIRDLVSNELDMMERPAAEVWENLQRLLALSPSSSQRSAGAGAGGGTGEVEENEPDIGPVPERKTFKAVLKDFKERYYLDQRMQDGLAIMFATVLSIQLPGDPIWMFMVGPPGAGKTLLLKAFSRSDWCVFKSSITPRSLISGYMAPNGQDPSLINILQGKVLVLKDYTEIMTMQRDAQEEMYGILRGAYDGFCEKTFGNGITRQYKDSHFALLAGVTDLIHGDDRAALGERFLKYQLIEGDDYNPEEQILAAIEGMPDQLINELYLRRVTGMFTNRWAPEHYPKPEQWVVQRILGLSQIVSYLRASVPRVRKDEIAYRPTPEVGTRLAKQLIKIGQCLAVIFGTSKIDRRAYGLMEQTAFNTCRGWGLDIVKELVCSKEPVKRDQLENKLHIPGTTCHRRLEDLEALGAVRKSKLSESRPGRPSYGWEPTPRIRELWTRAKLED